MSSKGLKPTKRKDNESSEKPDALKSKKPKLAPSNNTIQNQKPGGQEHGKPKSFGNNDKSVVTLSKKERRVQAKVLKNLIFFFCQSFKNIWIWNLLSYVDVFGGCRSWQKQGRRGGSLTTLSSKYVPFFSLMDSSTMGIELITLRTLIYQELATLWEKMRRRDIGKEDRLKLVVPNV